MSEEKKNEVNEEVKEARELTGKEPARVSGGVGPAAGFDIKIDTELPH
ncbi:MAG: hypothetical protein Q4A04_07505 [Eubacteriales bacterium]|nr:hypothetical protein [Eubacteriales bacterium]